MPTKLRLNYLAESHACRLFMNNTLLKVIVLLALATLSAGWHQVDKTKSNPSIPLVIGQKYGGGIIFFIDSTGQHGLIAAPGDQSTASKWGCGSIKMEGTSTRIGTGKENTRIIVKACKDANIPARICDDLVLNGYSDWFLPSKDELSLLYQHRKLIGGFAGSPYWSSSPFNPFYAWLQDFRNGYQVYTDLYYAYHVRAIRSF